MYMNVAGHLLSSIYRTLIYRNVSKGTSCS